MSRLRILHNPRCSKSRQTLQLLVDKGYQPEVVDYINDPLGIDELKQLVKMLGFGSVRDLMRTNEAIYKSENLAEQTNEEKLYQALVTYPKLIERPIVICEQRAKIGRPPEQVLELF
jgi:arsenate reductase